MTDEQLSHALRERRVALAIEIAALDRSLELLSADVPVYSTDPRVDLSEAEAFLGLPTPIVVRPLPGIVGADGTAALARFNARSGIDYDPDAIERGCWDLNEVLLHELVHAWQFFGIRPASKRRQLLRSPSMATKTRPTKSRPASSPGRCTARASRSISRRVRSQPPLGSGVADKLHRVETAVGQD